MDFSTMVLTMYVAVEDSPEADERILGIATTLLGDDFNYTGSDGNYYGVTPFGGVFHAGDLFKITPAGLLTELHSFGGRTILR